MDDRIPKPKERYVILIAGMIVQLCAGIIYMWAVFKGPVAEFLEKAPEDIALVSSVMLSAFVIGIIIGGTLQDRLGPRKITLIGSITMSVGILSSSFVTAETASLIYITYGVIGGLGVGTVYMCTVACVQKWFPDRRGFATGAMVGAFGFSLVIFAPLAESLLGSAGVPNTFRIFGLAFLIVCVGASLILCNPPRDYSVSGASAKRDSDKKQYTPREMVRTVPFYLISGSMFFVLPAYFILNPNLVSLAADRGLAGYAVSGVMITGLFSATGRLLITWLSDRTGRDGALFLISVMTAIGVVILTFATGALFLVCVAIISLAFGGASGTYAAITADYFGTKNMGANYGLVTLGFGASALIFPFLSNIISEPGDMTNAFILSAVTCAIAFVLVLILKIMNSRNGNASVGT
ncbi:MAG TPA: OFA family MFS transporter [Candidatus Methanomethylophilaceae archaeon]|nr:OFA family MFS transporter [Candidatus Methanomethylophilaceae archaeon]